MIRAVIFDCFGVLVGRGFEATYREAGGDPVQDRDFIKRTLDRDNRGLISHQEFDQAMAGKLGISVETWRSAVQRAERPDERLLNFIASLKSHHKTAVISNANKGTLARLIGEERVEQCFDEVVVSAEVGMLKPDPDIYEYAARKLGVSLEECVFVDDREDHCQGARDAGMQAVLYRDFDFMRQQLEQVLANTED